MSVVIGKKRNIQSLRGLSTNRSLLSCQPDGKVVDLWNLDDGSGRQEWNIVLVEGFEDVYNIIVYSGTLDNRSYLSCVPDGSRVDLWHTDDHSGRQQWQFTKLTSNIPDYFNIKVYSGVTSGRTFLSCVPDGSRVDLYDRDDESGHQRWQLQ